MGRVTIHRALRFGLSVVVMASTVPCGASGQTLRGRIIDSVTGDPVMLAYVGLVAEGENLVVAGLADSDGAFSVTAPDQGSYFVYVARSGYETIMDGLFELGDDGVFDVRIGLKPEPIALEALSVEVENGIDFLESQGFYQRAIASRGTFLIREEIERVAAYRITDAFRNIPLVEVDGTIPLIGGAGSLQTPAIRIRRANRRAACSPTFYIDRHMVASGINMDVRPDDFINPAEVEAIEIYARSSEVPLEFDEINNCGVVLVWTRRR